MPQTSTTAQPLTSPTSPSGIARKATRGALSLGVRQILVQGINVIGGLLLARLLPPSEFGVYAVTTFILNFLAVFGDIGLAASLVRQQSEPTDHDYQVVFTAQQVLALLVMALLWLASSRLASGYDLPPDGAWLFRLIGISIVVMSFQTASRARLERALSFDKLALVDVAQALVFNVAAVLLASAQVGILSFPIALVLRALASAVLVNRISPWALRWRVDANRVREHMAFGLPYQGTQLANLTKDTITPVFIGLILGPEAVGYVNWATMVASYPIFAVTILQRLYLPLFARLVPHPAQLARVLETVISLVTGAVYTASVLIFVYRHDVVIAVFGAKWQPALALFFPFLLLNILLAPTIIAFSVLNALGQARRVFYFVAAWAGLTWTLGPVSVLAAGWQGWGWANLGVNVANLWILRHVSIATGTHILRPIVRSLVAASFVGLAASLCSRIPYPPVAILAASTAIAAVLAMFYAKTVRLVLRAFRSAPGTR